MEWRKLAMWQIAGQAKGRKHIGSYKLTILAVRPDKRKRDLGNLEKSVSDILVGQNIIEDDSLCEWLEVKWVEQGPQCKIIIESLEEATGDDNSREVTES
jgi:Holliday junction resolvase RusA-like endonuclease